MYCSAHHFEHAGRKTCCMLCGINIIVAQARAFGVEKTAWCLERSEALTYAEAVRRVNFYLWEEFLWQQSQFNK